MKLHADAQNNEKKNQTKKNVRYFWKEILLHGMLHSQKSPNYLGSAKVA